LGSEYAGLFSNDDKLSKQILNAREKLRKIMENASSQNYDNL